MFVDAAFLDENAFPIESTGFPTLYGAMLVSKHKAALNPVHDILVGS